MRRDRTGEPVEDQDDGHRCRRGWLGDDAEGRPRPCAVCRPWLVEVPARKPLPDELDAFRARWPVLVVTSRRRTRT